MARTELVSVWGDWRKRLLPGNRGISFLAENMNGLNARDPVTAIGGTRSQSFYHLWFMTADPERGHRSIRLSRAHIFALPARLRTLRHFANSLSFHGGECRFLFSIVAIDTIPPAFEEPVFPVTTLTSIGKCTIDHMYHNSIRRIDKKRSEKKDCKIINHGKKAV